MTHAKLVLTGGQLIMSKHHVDKLNFVTRLCDTCTVLLGLLSFYLMLRYTLCLKKVPTFKLRVTLLNRN